MSMETLALTTNLQGHLSLTTIASVYTQWAVQ